GLDYLHHLTGLAWLLDLVEPLEGLEGRTVLDDLVRHGRRRSQRWFRGRTGPRIGGHGLLQCAIKIAQNLDVAEVDLFAVDDDLDLDLLRRRRLRKGRGAGD